METAGFPNCEGFPPISVVTDTGQTSANWLQFAIAGWEEHLGCDPSLFTIEALPFRERLAATDRAVLRMGTAELLFNPHVPTPVVLDEAIEIAKKFGSPKSVSFVNGVLDRVAKNRPDGED